MLVYCPLKYGLSLAAIYAGGISSLEIITAALVSSWLLGAVVTWIIVIAGRGTHVEKKAPHIREVFAFGSRGMVGAVSPVDDLRVDQMLVGFAVGAESLGLYVAAAPFSNLPKFVSQSIGIVAYPRIAAPRVSDVARKLSKRSVAIRMSLSMAVFVALLALDVPTVPARELIHTVKPETVNVRCALCLRPL